VRLNRPGDRPPDLRSKGWCLAFGRRIVHDGCQLILLLCINGDLH
jgi:hypothetical protein